MKNLTPIEYAGQRVLIYNQIATVFECNADVIRKVFYNDKEKFVEGEHYFNLSGGKLRQFKKSLTVPALKIIGRFTNTIYLFTAQGVALVSKLFDTDEALKIYAELEREYFAAPAANAAPEAEQPAENLPQIFVHPKFGKLRIVIIDGVVYFVAKDVATALGYKNGSRDIERHVDRQDRLEYRIGTLGQSRKVIVINKSGLYSLVLDSRLPKAKEYRHWVTSEVLPTIDEKGSYSVNAEYEDDPTIEHADPNRSGGQLKDACAYGFLMSNNQVKIGNTSEIPDRIKRVERATKLKVRQEHHTPYTTREKARIIERTLHRIFAAQRLEGEFFNVPFEDVKDEINNQSCLLAEEIHERITEPIDDVKERAKLLIELCHIAPNSPLQENLIKETANLLFGEKIF